MENPKNPKSKANKIAPSYIIAKLNSLIEGTKEYNEEDFNKMIKTINAHPNKAEVEKLNTILRMNTSGKSVENHCWWEDCF